MRADRMLSILLLLQNEGKKTAKELAERLEVSERTILRDMEALSMSGVPVYSERGSGGGWLLADGYRTSLTGIKAEEFLSLIVSAHPGLLTDLGIKKHFDATYQKLLASSPASIKNNIELIQKKFHIDGAGWHQAKESYPYLSTVQEAVWANLKLCIHYKRDQETLVRTVCPLGLVAKRSVWYFVADCDGALRTYRVSRIAHAEVLQESFPYPQEFHLANYWEASTAEFKQRLPRFPAKLKVSEQLLGRLEQENYITILEKAPGENGWLEATIQFATLEHACEMILGFGSLAQVLSPEELRIKVLAEIHAMLAGYENHPPLSSGT
ncbi:helix-turn-helix transcriptional regulator [Brevibacillus panacihumi]|uniref:YafY family transcriptional regulator n=1 Tax=Brevibacillus panacihumi TaxID=497735 RepID=A0A3M8CRL7_9BACL|nr:YafY family protein [Brevibacillus panacihumi]RNB78323.1 YafY family transcriptional regulator [Brevibacillus panacihumi]